MKKLALILLFSLVVSHIAYAQTMDLAGEIGDDATKYENQTEESRSGAAFETKKEEKTVADDRGIFSFLNFSFIKKPKIFTPKENTPSADSDGEATPKPIEETPLQKMIRLAEGGNLDAQLNLGYMYLYGENGVQADYSQAFHFYELAAAQNDKIALNNLGSLYFNGIGTETDYVKAAQLFAKAAQNGSDDAAVNLAFIYLSGTNKNKNLDEAVQLFKQAANAGNNTAKFMLGYAYYKGFRIERNFYKAVELLKAASDAQFDEAQYMLAVMYMNGQGIAKNYGNAVKFLRAAQKQGNVDATMQLADILAKGTMYPKNLNQAHVYYNIAAVYGAPQAATRRDALENALKIEDLLQAQSLAEKFNPEPSELTTYIRQTFGGNIRSYIDENMK